MAVECEGRRATFIIRGDAICISPTRALPIALRSEIDIQARLLGFWGLLVTRATLNMAAKILANLLVLGGGALVKAFAQAYKQALVNASKTGVAHETVQNLAQKTSKTMTLHEARQILGVSETTPWEEVLKKYDGLFERNAQMGSFYLQSKVHRAKECLEAAQRAGTK